MVKHKIMAVSLFIALLPLLSLNAQLQQQIDKLVQEENAGFGNVVYVVLSSLELYNENEPVAGALQVLSEKNWGIKIKGEDEKITLSEFSYLLMRAFNMKGGLMYTLFPGPRYAVRELDYYKLIPGSTDPDRKLSGEDVMTIFTMVANSMEEGK